MQEETIKSGLVNYIVENQERFYRVAYGHVGEREAALDVVQNAVVKALEKYGTIRRPEYMETWFYRVLLNECYDYLRRYGREVMVEPEYLQKMQEGSKEMTDGEDIFEKVMGLPDKMKTVVILRFYEEFSLEEISRATGSGLSTVKYRLYTGLKLLKQEMREEVR